MADVDHHSGVCSDPELVQPAQGVILTLSPLAKAAATLARESVAFQPQPVSRVSEGRGFPGREGTAGLFLGDHLQASHVFGPRVNKAEPPSAVRCSKAA